MAHRPAILPIVFLFSAVVARAAGASSCAPPSGLHDGPHPAIAVPDPLVSHMEVVVEPQFAVSGPRFASSAECSPAYQRRD
jgi:hypothetical protein